MRGPSPSTDLDVRVLGPVEVRVGGEPVALGGPRQRALVARLVLDRGRTVPAGTLIADLWPDPAPPTAAKMVQVSVSQLRKVLPVGLLVTQGPGYRLDLDDEAADLGRFERLRDEGRRAAEAGDDARAAARLREALALWRGDALGEFDEPFATGEAARLEEARLASLEDRIDADLRLGRHEDLPGELEALVARHPLRERLREQLMIALYRSGRQAESLASYNRFRATLDDELGIAPSRRLQELQMRILRHDPGLDVARAPAARDPRGQTIAYATAPDGARLAWARHGSGPPLVRIATWFTHLELDWESPVWRHWIEGLGHDRTLVRYDERGCGLSTRDLGSLTVDQWVADLEAVVDAAGLDTFDLLGMSQGGSIALTYAARHPERVRRMVIYGAYPRGRLRRDDPAQVRESVALVSLIRKGWGTSDPAYRRVFTNLFLPGGNEEQLTWFDDVQRRTTDAETAARLREARDAIDVTPILPEVRTPTLVFHADRDRIVPVEEGRFIAAQVPGAEYVELPTANHILLHDEISWGTFLGATQMFLAGEE